jgi:antitoxin (DNA-binding transcriptional repressor) of toxin-antitoxin stability system
MRSVSVRDLRYDFKSVERLLRAGEEVRVTKRRKVIARLVPEPAPKVEMPDFIARMRANFGDRVLEVSGAELISADREGR